MLILTNGKFKWMKSDYSGSNLNLYW